MHLRSLVVLGIVSSARALRLARVVHTVHDAAASAAFYTTARGLALLM